MIATLRGTLVAKSPTDITVDVNGVGYGVHIPLSTFEKLGDVNSAVFLYTHLHVREDALQLFGFATEEERGTFRLLLSVNGIGPKMAQGILSGIPAPEFKSLVAQGNAAALTRIPGIGRKIAERLVVELREKVTRLEEGMPSLAGATDGAARIRSEALSALVALGYNRSVAEKALRTAIQDGNGSDATVEALIKSALRHATNP